MEVRRHRSYDKAWQKLSLPEQKRALACLELFLLEPQNKKLRLHQLKGKYYPQYSLSASGDLRIHFQQTAPDAITLMLVGTHAQLYG